MAGGPSAVAGCFGITPQALYRFTSKGCWPRTEFTGETDYSARLSRLLATKAIDVSAATLLGLGRRAESAA